MMGQFFDYPMFFIFFVGAGIVLLACEIGWQLGKRNEGIGVSNHIAGLEQVLLGLVALIVGFSFVMGITRFEGRREATVSLANAIGTMALRARLLPDPTRKETLKLLREYAQMRVDYSITREELLTRSNEIHEKLWQHAETLPVKDNNIVPNLLFTQALNEMIDDQAKRLAELRNQIPNEVLIVLFAITAVSCGFAGYASRLDPLRTRLPTVITATILCAVIFVIIDLDSPRVRIIKGDRRPLIDLVAGLPVITD